MEHKHNASILVAVLGLLITACGEPKADFKKEEPFRDSDSLLKSLIIDTVHAGDAAEQLTLNGRVVPDEDKMVRIFPMVSGIVQDVHVHSGDLVKKGEELATVQSMEVASYALEASAAKAEERQKQKALETTKELFESGLAAARDVEIARNEFDVARAAVKKAQAVMAINPSRDGLAYRIKSPVSGFVIEKKITDNMQLRADNAESVFTIADLSEMWILANIYETDVAKVHVGDRVRMTTLSYPDKIFDGRIEKIYNMLDPENKVMRARIRVPNPGFLLKPEMFATVTVSGKSATTMPVVKSGSLIFDNDQYYAVIVGADNKLQIRPVKLAAKVEDRAYIASGLKAGDRIAASRQLFLYESLK